MKVIKPASDGTPNVLELVGEARSSAENSRYLSLSPSPHLVRPSVRVCLQLPAGSASVGSSIRQTDWRLMRPASTEEAVCLTDDPSEDAPRLWETHPGSTNPLHAVTTSELDRPLPPMIRRCQLLKISQCAGKSRNTLVSGKPQFSIREVQNQKKHYCTLKSAQTMVPHHHA